MVSPAPIRRFARFARSTRLSRCAIGLCLAIGAGLAAGSLGLGAAGCSRIMGDKPGGDPIPSYPDGPAGLEALFRDVLAAAKADDRARVHDLFQSLKMTRPELDALFGPRAADLAHAYDEMMATLIHQGAVELVAMVYEKKYDAVEVVVPEPAAAEADAGQPTPGKTPAPGKTFAPDQTPAAGKTPAPEKTAAAGKLPAPAKTPAAGKTRSPGKTPVPDNTPAPDKTSAAAKPDRSAAQAALARALVTPAPTIYAVRLKRTGDALGTRYDFFFYRDGHWRTGNLLGKVIARREAELTVPATAR